MKLSVAARRPVFAFLALGVVALVVFAAMQLVGGVNETVTTDKPDYFTNETVTITGSGFAASTNYDIPVIRPPGPPTGSIVVGDGSETPGWDTVTTDGSGSFTYLYKLNGMQGVYEVRVYLSPWSGNLAETPLASTTFTDSTVRHHQFRNGTTKATVDSGDEWTTGNIGSANSDLVEGDSVNYRYEFKEVDAGAVIELEIGYEFNKGTQYAFDFLTSSERTEGNAALDLFSSPLSPITGLSEAGCTKTAVPIPDDTTPGFDIDNDLATAEGTQYFTI